MNNRLEGLVAIITGGGGRIGAATAQRMAAEGARVVVADLFKEAAVKVATAIGDNALPLHFDASSPESIEALIADTVDAFGRIDILHNNAALTDLDQLNLDTTVIDTPIDIWDNTLATNVRSFYLAAKHAIPHMLSQGGGSIINTASGAGIMAENSRIAYGVSKGAVITLTKYIATHHGRQGVRCNAIAPGLIVNEELEQKISDFVKITKRHLLAKRSGRPEDIAALAAFLASSDAEFINGQTICCDGGLLVHTPAMADVLDMSDESWGR
ncbi:MAG: short-chain dehydrogenase [Gammaproteobacteria bacterium BRH_c0]|nr:MAG: short-chain dehydrogenase [Gammaproteobacteria bacterium BRH_c0]